MLTYTYRDDRASERPRTDLIGDWVWFLILAGLAVRALVGTLGDRSWGYVVPALIWVLLAVVVARCSHVRRYYQTCLEIRLGDDGVCEFVTRRRTIRLHARQIRAVKYCYDDEGNRTSYMIRCDLGKLFVSSRVDGFGDFVLRLSQVNPAVDVSR